MDFLFPNSFWFWLIPSLILAAAIYGFIFFRTPSGKISIRTGKNENRSLPAKVIIQETSIPVQHGSVYFGAGSSEIESEFFASLDFLGKSLKERTNWNLQISGWTDRFGNPATNRRLSFERAKKIQSYLCRKWELPAASIQIQGMGVEPRSIGAERARRADWKLIL
ncbi:hypothetical protein A0128_15040 [Leptospira tipperaryensis]|uniref:OmpA-like domain-containing protein n=1 Tax=Leptospira tipperaryensis TaxID=2564040 RepID=A0A1D7UZN7_9LEPT|nr:OmpA family protein [Leptospira tipperaryensis]AOP35044.1 hypothetical protein A0128_15040 [Leptospira tipperaryensis]